MTLAHDYGGSHSHPGQLAKVQDNFWPSAAIMAIVFVTFRPLSDPEVISGSGGSGDLVNQLGFGGLGLICLYLLFKKTSSQAISALTSPLWLLMLPASLSF